jgi:pilus assembly protein CpaB
MKWSVVGLALLGVAAALCAAVLMASLRNRPATLVLPGAGQSQRVTVLVAQSDLPALRAVPADAVTTTTMAQNQAPDEYFSEPAQIIGKVLAAPVKKGQAFSASLFATRGSGSNLAATLPDGKRAVMVSLSNAGSLGGLLYPGARVDVLASFAVQSAATGRAMSTTLLQGIEVLAIEGETVGTDPATPAPTGSKPSPNGPTITQNVRITLLLTPPQAEALQVAASYGNISLSLRNPTDSQEVRQNITLLKEGQLSSISGGDLGMNPPPGPANQVALPPQSPATQPLFAVRPPAPPPWDVTVLRGSAAEVHSFPVSKSSNVGGDNDEGN